MHPPKMGCSAVGRAVLFSRPARFAAGEIGLVGGVINANPSFLHGCVFSVNVPPKAVPGKKIGVALITADPPTWSGLRYNSRPAVEGTLASFPLQSTKITEL
jgi:hypothetical protein